MEPVSLPIHIPAVPDQRWSCHSCTRCCRELVGDLREADRRRLDEQQWERRLGVAPYVSVRHKWALNKRPDGRCVFLQDDGLCRIHAELGFDAKPFACRAYPFTLVEAQGKWWTAWRFDCPSMARANGADLTTYRRLVRSLSEEMPVRGESRKDGILLRRARPAAPAEIHALLDALNAWLLDGSRPLEESVAAAASLVDTLRLADLDRVREDRFVELVKMLVPDLPSALEDVSRDPPTPRQQGLFRQLVFAYTEHLTLEEIRSRRTRWMRRLQQLGWAGRFRRGHGRVPPVAGMKHDVTFEAVKAVRPANTDVAHIASMLGRFLRMRILSHYQFGPAYYGWPALDGLRALWLVVPVVGWLARYLAAARHADRFTFQDVLDGLALVDGAIGRSASLGTPGERLRLDYLSRSDGACRLVRYWGVSSSP